MKSITPRRYVATQLVRAEIIAQGRRFDWVADHVGISKSFLTRILSGERTVDEATARLIAALLGKGFLSLFEVPKGTKEVPETTEKAEAA